MGLYPVNLNEYVASMGIPRGPLSQAYLVDPVNGDDDNTGKSWRKPLKTLTAAEALCTGDQHDAVLFLSGDSPDEPTAAIAWDKDFTHLIGLSGDLYGVGQRCRVVATAANDINTAPIVFSGNGCIVKNMQFNNEHATGTATGCGIVTGHRNYFENVFFMAPTSQTAAAYSLKVGGTENVFKRCTIGQHTLVRNAASYGLWLYEGDDDCQRNKFVDCEFLSWATGGGTAHVHVYVAVGIDVEVYTVQFERCLFNNIGAATLAVAIDDNCATTDHQILLRGQNQFARCTAVADPLTYVLHTEIGTGTASGLLMATVNES